MAQNEPLANDLTLHQADDFKSISGIKQGIESRLHAAGVLTYAQLASLTPEEIIAALGKVVGYTTRRIAEEDWAGQARELDRAQQNQPTPEIERLPEAFQPEERAIRQHYATFTIELLLGEENAVRRTRIVYIQNEAEETWAGWDEARLVGFITGSAQVQNKGLAGKEPDPDKDATLEKDALPKQAAPPPVTGEPRLRELAIISPSTGSQRRIVAQGQPFDITLTLDFSEVQAAAEKSLAFHLMAYAKRLGSPERQVLCTSEGTLSPGETTTLQIKSEGLPEGTYRLAFDFSANGPSSPPLQPDLTAVLDGGLIKVY